MQGGATNCLYTVLPKEKDSIRYADVECVTLAVTIAFYGWRQRIYPTFLYLLERLLSVATLTP